MESLHPIAVHFPIALLSAALLIEALALAKHSLQIHQVMARHERLGYVVLAGVFSIVVWRLLARDRLAPWTRWILWILLAVTCGLMGFGATLGGRLVYEFGVGGSYGRSNGMVIG